MPYKHDERTDQASAQAVRAPAQTMRGAPSAPDLRRAGWLAAITMTCALMSCLEPSPMTPPMTPPMTTPKPQAPRCRPGPGATGSPQTIEQAVALINTLPRPVTVDCVVQALDRPLHMNATDSIFSAQPAQGRSSPRVFIFSGPLILSVTLGSQGLHLLEFGQLLEDEPGVSIKGELAFPVQDELPPSAPYAHIRHNDRLTTCGLCHAQERERGHLDGVPITSSRALRPSDRFVIPLVEVWAEVERCDPQAEPARCALLRALFEREPAQERLFPESIDVFF